MLKSANDYTIPDNHQKAADLSRVPVSAFPKLSESGIRVIGQVGTVYRSDEGQSKGWGEV
ncbi:hypothetical protein HMPREF9374_2035 [Desmospora sp. 8437]|nr:hypothetical protein HMPREF9374_2035 [Desmospora sp. 8437]